MRRNALRARYFAIHLAAVLALIAMGAAAGANAQKYTLAAIPNPLGGVYRCNPAAVNAHGQAVGWFEYGFDLTDIREPFLYDSKTGTHILPMVPGYYFGEALGINDSGQVVGYLTNSDGPNGGIPAVTGFVWDSVHGSRQIDQIADSNGVTAASLGWTITDAWDINTQGDILVEGTYGAFGTDFRGIWRMTTTGGLSTVSVQTLPFHYNTGEIGWGTRLNDKGIVLGTDFDSSTLTVMPALWDSSSNVLTDVGGAVGVGIALNNNGDVAGNGVTYYDQYGDWHYSGTAWFSNGNGTATDLGSLNGGSFVKGINDLNQVVGGSAGSAFLWQNGVIQDLNKVMGGGKWILISALAISGPANSKLTAGCIVGVGTLSGTPTAWVATPK